MFSFKPGLLYLKTPAFYQDNKSFYQLARNANRIKEREGLLYLERIAEKPNKLQQTKKADSELTKNQPTKYKLNDAPQPPPIKLVKTNRRGEKVENLSIDSEEEIQVPLGAGK